MKTNTLNHGFFLQPWWTCNKPPHIELSLFAKSNFRPVRLHKATYLKALDRILANLIYASKVGAYVIYRRDNSESAVTKTLIDWLFDSGYVFHQKGQQNQFKGIASRVWLSDKAKLELAKRKVTYQLAKGIPFLKMRDKSKKEIPLPSNPTIIKQLNEPCEAINRLWLDNSAVFGDTGEHVIPFVHRAFNESFEFGGRFYFPSQTVPSHRRESILINGEPTVELDYKAIHFNLLYAERGLQFSGDPYCTTGFERKVIKLSMLSFLNSENDRAWKGHITRCAKPKAKQAFINGTLPKDQAASFVHQKNKETGELLLLPDNTSGVALAEAIKERHAPIADSFHKPKIGVRLQRKDSEIMSLCLTECAKRNIPVLPYHDGIRCPESAKEEVYQIMKDAYRKVTGFEIEVETECTDKPVATQNSNSESCHDDSIACHDTTKSPVTPHFSLSGNGCTDKAVYTEICTDNGVYTGCSHNKDRDKLPVVKKSHNAQPKRGKEHGNKIKYRSMF